MIQTQFSRREQRLIKINYRYKEQGQTQSIFPVQINDSAVDFWRSVSPAGVEKSLHHLLHGLPMIEKENRTGGNEGLHLTKTDIRYNKDYSSKYHRCGPDLSIPVVGFKFMSVVILLKQGQSMLIDKVKLKKKWTRFEHHVKI